MFVFHSAMVSGALMSLLSQITAGLTILAGIGLYAGLDKLVNIFLLLALLTLTRLFDRLSAAINNPDLRIPALLNRGGSHGGNERARSVLRIAANIAGLAVCVFALFELYQLSLGLNLSVYESLNRQVLYLASSLGLFFYGIFAMRTLQELPDKAAATQWYRAVCYFAMFHAAVFSLSLFSSMLSENDAQIFIVVVDSGYFAGFFSLALLVAEFSIGFVRSISLLSQKKQVETVLPVPFFISFFAAEESLKRSLIKSIETISGVDVSRSEIVSFFVRIFEPVCIIALIIVWLMSSLVIVGPDKEAIFARFGRISEGKAFGPGIYFKLPWPLSSAQLFDSYKVRTINVGFEPDPQQRHIIWTKAHAVKYFDLIVGDGVEIIAIDCQIMFRINNLYKYIIGLQNPEEFISATTYKLLTQETVCARFDDIITRDRKILADLIKSKLQQAADDKDLGVSIVEVVFLAMHPPLEVADAFEDVISAQIDKYTYELKANAENSYKLSMSKALARGKELEAESFAARHVAKAEGDASSFASRTLGYEFDPELTSFRLRYERMQQVLTGKNLYIIDKSLMRKEDRLFLDINGQER